MKTITAVTILALFIPAAAAAYCNPYTFTGCTYGQKLTIRSQMATAASYERERQRQERALALAIAKEEAKAAKDYRRRCNSYHGCGKGDHHGG